MAASTNGRRRVRVKAPLPVCHVDGESSADDDEAEALTSTRACCGQFVWPCPREYPQYYPDRRARNWFIPADLSKAECGLLFKNTVTKCGLGPNLVKINVFDEPHKRYNRVTGVRERHKHILFKMKTTFAHLQIQKALAAKGVYGHFSFNLVGYVKYLQYCIVPSAKKLQADIDQEPWSWPSVAPSALLALCEKLSPQMEARNGSTGGGRKRKFMTFSEVTDAFVEGGIRTEKEAWMLAKSLKVGGDNLLFDTLGATPCVSTLVGKVRKAWDCEAMTSGTLCTQPDYPLDRFVPPEAVHDGLLAWMEGGWKTHSLILHGRGGLGKTEYGCALMKKVAPAGAYHFINKVDRVRDVVFGPGEGLVVDEACFSSMDVDDVKNLLDLEKGRDITCRNRDGHIPKLTPRIFSTNWPWELFWPVQAWIPLHAGAIHRRHFWIEVTSDLRVPVGAFTAEGLTFV